MRVHVTSSTDNFLFIYNVNKEFMFLNTRLRHFLAIRSVKSCLSQTLYIQIRRRKEGKKERGGNKPFAYRARDTVATILFSEK